MKTLLKHDFIHLLKTKKFIIIPAVVALTSLFSPLTAMYLPQLINSLSNIDGLIISLPEPTVMDAYAQYFSDLNETILFLIIFIAISIFIKDKTKGMFPMILSKPISRRNYLLSKFITFMVLTTISLLVGILCFSFYTYVLFEELSFIDFLISNLFQLIYFGFIVALCMFFATVNKSYVTALMSSFGVYLLLIFLSIFNIAPFKYFPNKLTTLYYQIILKEVDMDVLLISTVVTLVVTMILIISSIKLLEKQEL